MIRTQVQLTEQQLRQLRKVAIRDGVSIAEVIRRCIDRGIGDRLGDSDTAYEAAATCVGSFRDRDDASDVAEEHDGYLGDAFE
ncbi:MAG: CopG family transcriptional regulator [Deltaproteobacteria bacterium]|nr:CopG family transcriptional regulator [Deltaproteobacteria bacterium]